MKILLIIGVILFVNAFIGASVLAYIDDDNESLFKWYDSAPSVWLQPLILELWVVILYLYWRNR